MSVEVIRAAALGRRPPRLPRPPRRRLAGRLRRASTSASARATTAPRSARIAAAPSRRSRPARALVTVHQVHSADALYATAPWPDDARPQADAIVTDRPGLALGILTADCTPVLLADREAGVIARRPCRLEGRVRRRDRSDARGDGAASAPTAPASPPRSARSSPADPTRSTTASCAASPRPIRRTSASSPPAARAITSSTSKPMSSPASPRPASPAPRRSASTPMPTRTASSATAAPPTAASPTYGRQISLIAPDWCRRLQASRSVGPELARERAGNGPHPSGRSPARPVSRLIERLGPHAAMRTGARRHDMADESDLSGRDPAPPAQAGRARDRRAQAEALDPDDGPRLRPGPVRRLAEAADLPHLDLRLRERGGRQAPFRGRHRQAAGRRRGPGLFALQRPQSGDPRGPPRRLGGCRGRARPSPRACRRSRPCCSPSSSPATSSSIRARSTPRPRR